MNRLALNRDARPYFSIYGQVSILYKPHFAQILNQYQTGGERVARTALAFTVFVNIDNNYLRSERQTNNVIVDERPYFHTLPMIDWAFSLSTRGRY